jgi:hypothetical protein
MPKEVFVDLGKAWVCGQRLNISRLEPPRKRKQANPTRKTGGKRTTD